MGALHWWCIALLHCTGGALHCCIALVAHCTAALHCCIALVMHCTVALHWWSIALLHCTGGALYCCIMFADPVSEGTVISPYLPPTFQLVRLRQILPWRQIQ